MQISCPICGSRDVREFTYIGDATRKIPSLEDDSEVWAHYVWDRKNPRGNHSEHWQHSHGCRQFIEVDRNTATHEISDTKLVGPISKGTQK